MYVCITYTTSKKSIQIFLFLILKVLFLMKQVKQHNGFIHLLDGSLPEPH